MIFFVFILGLIVGSFLNVLIFRLHEGESFVSGRSVCRNCKKIIAWYDNVPLLSYLLLRGRCRKCQKPVGVQYPLVELSCGALFVLAYISVAHHSVFALWEAREWLLFLRNTVFLSFLVVIFVYDLRWMYILDVVTVPAGIIAFVMNILLGVHWFNLLAGVIIGGGFFLAQFMLSRGKWIGGGDIRLGAVMGAMLGWQLLLVSLFIAYTVGAAMSILLVAFGKKKFAEKIAFGTFLSLSCGITLLWGNSFLSWYLGLL